jgi:Calcineurin-like phosphoesterase
MGAGPQPSISDDDFISLFRSMGPFGLAKRLGQSKSTIYQRRRRIEKAHKIALVGPYHQSQNLALRPAEYPHRVCLEVENGVVLVGSDAHYWPGEPSLAHKFFVKFCKELEPVAVIMNGDVMDCATISRHPPIGWEKRPTVQQEVETAQERLHEIEKMVKRRTPLIWTLGNHDSRFETRLATVAPEFGKVTGVHLKDHFAAWQACWSVFINDDVVVKHRFKGGIHAPHNNTINAGRSMVTGHLHSAKVIPWSDYNGTRYGVDTGCLADVDHAAFTDYTEDNPRNWRSAFGVLTFEDGKLLPPELATKFDEGRFTFRGKLLEP